MSDSFMHYHQSALDNQMEDNAIQDLQNSGIYPEPDNDAVLESIAENYYIQPTYIEDGLTMSKRYVIRDEDNQIVRHYWKSSWTSKIDAEQALSEIVQEKFEELPEPLDNS